jgi:hypothetical protein
MNHNILIIFIFFIRNVFCEIKYKWLINNNEAIIQFSSDIVDQNNGIPSYYYGISDISSINNFDDIWFYDGYYYLNIKNCRIINNCESEIPQDKYIGLFYYDIKRDCNFNFDIYNIYEANGIELGAVCGSEACNPEDKDCNKVVFPTESVNMRRKN